MERDRLDRGGIVWTERQREVLDLVADGHTNTEIAQQLGITLAGAKWHVSEAISKLGVATRDDVAEYWRHERRFTTRARRVPRQAIALLSFKTIAAGLAAVALVGLAAASSLLVVGDDTAASSIAIEPTVVPAPMATRDVPGAPLDIETAYAVAAQATADCMRDGGADVKVTRGPQGQLGFDYGSSRPSPNLVNDCYLTNLAEAERAWQQNNPALELSSVSLGHEVMQCYLESTPSYVFPDEPGALQKAIAELSVTSGDFQDCFASTTSRALAAVGQSHGSLSIAFVPFGQ